MKALLVMFAMFATAAIAAENPVLTTAPIDPLATHCGWSVDGSDRQPTNAVHLGEGKYCSLSLSGLMTRGHVINVTASYVDSVLGLRESEPSENYVIAPAPIPAAPTGLTVKVPTR